MKGKLIIGTSLGLLGLILLSAQDWKIAIGVVLMFKWKGIYEDYRRYEKCL